MSTHLQVRELRSQVSTLQAHLELAQGIIAGQGLEAPDVCLRPQEWMKRLTTNERAYLGALIGAYPKLVRRDALLDAMPAKSWDEDRSPNLVSVVRCHIHKKLGRKVVEYQRGLGYTISKDFYVDLLMSTGF